VTIDPSFPSSPLTPPFPSCPRQARSLLRDAQRASIQQIPTVAFATYIQKLSLDVLAFRANLSAEIYDDIDAKQLRAGDVKREPCS